MADINLVVQENIVAIAEIRFISLDVLNVGTNIVPSYAHYKLNDNIATQNVLDSSGNGRNGTITGSSDNSANISVAAKVDRGFTFPGAINYVDCGAIVATWDYTTSFTLECWLKLDAIGTEVMLFAKGSASYGITLSVLANGRLVYNLKTNGATRQIEKQADVSLEDNAWHHIVATYDGSTVSSGMILYIDNAVPATYSTTDTYSPGDSIINPVTFQIGARNGSSKIRNAILDECVLYQSVLSATQVSQRWNAGSGTENLPTFGGGDAITISEYVSLSRSFPFSVYDSISIAENIALQYDVLNLEVFEFSGLLITEHIDVIDLVVEVGVVADFVSIVDYADMVIDVLYTNVFDSVSIAEYVGLAKEILLIDVYDEVIADCATEVRLPELNVYVFDIFAWSEYISTGLTNLVPDVYESITIIEDLTINLDILHLSVSESISIIEDLEVLIGTLYFDVFDSMSIVENLILNLDALNLSVYDAKIVVEFIDVRLVGTTLDVYEELIYIDEYVEFYFDALSAFAYDTITITESFSKIAGILFPDVFGSIAILEDISVNFDVLNLAPYDEIATTEFTTGFLDSQNTSVYDSITIAEYVELLDIVIDIGPVFDSIVVTENIDNIFAWLIDVYDDMLIEENISESFYIWKALYKMYLESKITEEVNVN